MNEPQVKIMRSVKWHIRHYYEIKKAVAEARLEQKRRSCTAERRSVGYVSDPTAAEAEKNLTALKAVDIPGGTVRRPEEWIEIIDKVMLTLDAQDRRLIGVTFWEPHSWLGAIDRLHLNKMTYYRRRDQILSMFAIAAAAKGLITF